MTGILPAHAIGRLIEEHAIRLAEPAAAGQIQPASLDLRLGRKAWRVRASFLPGEGQRVSRAMENLVMHEIDLEPGAVLERDCVYIASLMESLDLPENISAAANPKSSTGRIDVFTRVICDHSRAFDQIAAGYEGPLYAEICPQTFPVLVRSGSRLSQIRFRKLAGGEEDGAEAERERDENRLLADYPELGERIKKASASFHVKGLPLSVELGGGSRGRLIGYRARRHTGVIDVDRAGACAIDELLY